MFGKFSSGLGAFHKASVNFASTAAEATSAGATVTLPVEFKLDRFTIAIVPAGLADNAVLLVPSFAKSSGRVVATLKFHNANAAAGAAIDPGAVDVYFLQF